MIYTGWLSVDVSPIKRAFAGLHLFDSNIKMLKILHVLPDYIPNKSMSYNVEL